MKTKKMIDETQTILITPRKSQEYINGVNDFMIELKKTIKTKEENEIKGRDIKIANN